MGVHGIPRTFARPELAMTLQGMIGRAAIIKLAKANAIELGTKNVGGPFLQKLALAMPVLSSAEGVWTTRSRLWTQEFTHISAALTPSACSTDVGHTVWDGSWHLPPGSGAPPWALIRTPRAVFGLTQPNKLEVAPLEALVLASLEVNAVKESVPGGLYLDLATVLDAMPRTLDLTQYEAHAPIFHVVAQDPSADVATPWYCNVVTVGAGVKALDMEDPIRGRVAQVAPDANNEIIKQVLLAYNNTAYSVSPCVTTVPVNDKVVIWLVTLPLGIAGGRTPYERCHIAGVSEDWPTVVGAAAYALLRGVLSRSDDKLIYAPLKYTGKDYRTTLAWDDSVQLALHQIARLDCGVTHNEKVRMFRSCGMPAPLQSSSARAIELRIRTPAATARNSTLFSGSSVADTLDESSSQVAPTLSR